MEKMIKTKLFFGKFCPSLVWNMEDSKAVYKYAVDLFFSKQVTEL